METTDRRMDALTRALASAVEKFYEDPENRRKFEEWKEKKREAAQDT